VYWPGRTPAILNRPSSPATTPRVVPTRTTCAAGIGAFDAASTTRPAMVPGSCARASDATPKSNAATAPCRRNRFRTSWFILPPCLPDVLPQRDGCHVALSTARLCVVQSRMCWGARRCALAGRIGQPSAFVDPLARGTASASGERRIALPHCNRSSAYDNLHAGVWSQPSSMLNEEVAVPP